MNYSKAQKIVFESICKNSRGGRFMLDDGNIFVTPDGVRGYVFPVAGVCFNVEKIRGMGKLPIIETIKENNELKLTDDLRIIKRGGMMRRLKGKGKNVFVNVKYLDVFHNPRFYQDASGLGMIVVTEDMSVTKRNIPVGIVMPIRDDEIGGDYYKD